MQQRDFGNTGLTVSALGLGAGQVGDASLDESAAAALLNAALDGGVTLIDTARGYGISEERIGRHLAHRRAEFALSTKVGYGIAGHADWTGGCIAAGIDEALARLRTDVIDIVHLHSCPLDTLRAGEVIDALLRARTQGKLRVAAYSGENDELAWAVQSGHFGSVECSVNLFDQGSLHTVLPRAAAAGMGIIAKRPLGNAPWRHAQRPIGDYGETYWQRMQALALDTRGLPWDAFALRFSAYAPGIGSAIAGTGSVSHLRHNIALVEAGALAAEAMQEISRRYLDVGGQWSGEI
ncbi:MAG: aldo/keto reductase [Betaproteobacteria bacterium]